MTGRLVVLLGGDGSGKSTALRAARARRPAWRYTSIDPRDLYPLPGLEHMNWALSTHPAVYVARMGPLGRASYLAHTLALLAEERVLPALAAGDVVVCDSYYYRVLAKETALGGSGVGVIAALADRLPDPHLAVWLTVDPWEAWVRSGERCGFYETTGASGWAGFRRMQEHVERQTTTELLAGVPTIRLDGHARPEVVAAGLIAAIDELLEADRCA